MPKNSRRSRQTGGLSRKALKFELSELRKRLTEREKDAAALVELVVPYGGEMPWGQHCIYRAIGLALTKHSEGMRSLLGYVEAIDDATPGGAQ